MGLSKTTMTSCAINAVEYLCQEPYRPSTPCVSLSKTTVTPRAQCLCLQLLLPYRPVASLSKASYI